MQSGLASCTLYLRRRLVIVGAVEILRGAPAWGTSIDIRIHIVGVVLLLVAAPTEQIISRQLRGRRSWIPRRRHGCGARGRSNLVGLPSGPWRDRTGCASAGTPGEEVFG